MFWFLGETPYLSGQEVLCEKRENRTSEVKWLKKIMEPRLSQSYWTVVTTPKPFLVFLVFPCFVSVPRQQYNPAQICIDPGKNCEQSTNWYITSLGYQDWVNKKFTTLTLQGFEKIGFIFLKKWIYNQKNFFFFFMFLLAHRIGNRVRITNHPPFMGLRPLVFEL